MTTFEAIKKMNFMELARFLASIENDTFDKYTCRGTNCPFEPVCSADDIQECVNRFPLEFSAAKFLALDYEITKLEE